MTPARRAGDREHVRLVRWFLSPVGGPTWLTVLVILAAVAVAPSILGIALYERQSGRLDRQVEENQTTLIHTCAYGAAIEHLDRFFLAIAMKRPPDETADQRKLRLAFLELVNGDLKVIARSAKVCARLVD